LELYLGIELSSNCYAGFGDIVPTTTGGRVFTCLFSIFGFMSLAVTVTLTRETVLEALEIGYRKRVRNVRLRHKEAHRKRKIIERWRAAIEWRLRESGLPIWAKDDPEKHQHPRCVKVIYDLWPWSSDQPYSNHSLGLARTRMHPHGMHLNLEALTCAQLETAALETGVPLSRLLPPGFKMPMDQGDTHMARAEGHKSGTGVGTSMPRFVPTQPIGLPLTHARIGRMAVMLGTFAFAVTERSFATVAQATTLPLPKADSDDQSVDGPYHWSIAEQYESLRTGMEIEEKRAFSARLFVVWVLFITFWMVCVFLELLSLFTDRLFPSRSDLQFSVQLKNGLSVLLCIFVSNVFPKSLVLYPHALQGFIAFTTIGYGKYHQSTLIRPADVGLF
jgi:potassium channel subfamily K, other eukaryote